jgi:ABC-2 type transport system permease protein
MSPRSVFVKTIYDRRHGLIWWSAGIVLLTLATLSAWPSVRDEYERLVANYPSALLALFGIDKAEIGSAAGYLQAELFSFVVPIMLLAYMIAAGSAATAGEEESGTLELLLAHPVSRTRVLLEKYGGVCASLAVITASFVIALIAFTRAFDLGVGIPNLLAVTFSAYALAALYGAIALFVGGLTGHRALAAGIASAAAVIGYLLSSLGQLVHGLRSFRPASPFWWYSGNDPLHSGFSPVHVALLVAATVTSLLAAVVVFNRRDIVTR